MSATDMTLDRPSILLTLPRELRDQIYLCALAQAFAWAVDRDNCVQPALLRTCRQLRGEASTIFYQETSFQVLLVDCKFEPHPEHWVWNHGIHGALGFRGKYVGSNLKKWLQLYHEDGKINYDGSGEVSDRFVVIDKAFNIVRQMKALGSDWKATEGILDTFRAGVDAKKDGWQFE